MEPDESVVDILEHALELARAGKLRHFVLAAVIRSEVESFDPVLGPYVPHKDEGTCWWAGDANRRERLRAAKQIVSWFEQNDPAPNRRAGAHSSPSRGVSP